MKKKLIEELDSKATFLREKADDFFQKGKMIKGIKNLRKSAELYEKIATSMNDKEAWDLLVKVLVTLGKVFVDMGEYFHAAITQHRLAKIHLILGERDASADYYNVSAKFAIKGGEDEPGFIIHVTTMYCFIMYLKSEYAKAREFLKKILTMFDSESVKSTELYNILKTFFGSLTKRKMGKITIEESLVEHIGLSNEEWTIINHAVRLRKLLDGANVSFKIQEPSTEEGYLEGVPVTSIINMDIGNDDVIESITDAITITGISVEKSNDLAITEKFTIPSSIKFGGSLELKETFKSYYPGSNEIGPVKLELKIGEYLAEVHLDGITFEIHAQAVNIEINIEELGEPMIGKSFPLRIEVMNKSKGDANDLKIEITMPEDESIDMVRGTLMKKIFSLAAGESTYWEIMLRPNEEGTHELKAGIVFKDSERNTIGPVEKTIPLEIKL
ncbi:MAG: tetratricopeptide repeat protein [Promethearchaeota archaeon]